MVCWTLGLPLSADKHYIFFFRVTSCLGLVFLDTFGLLVDREFVDRILLLSLVVSALVACNNCSRGGFLGFAWTLGPKGRMG